MVQSMVQTRSSPFSRMRMWALACWRRRGKMTPQIAPRAQLVICTLKKGYCVVCCQVKTLSRRTSYHHQETWQPQEVSHLLRSHCLILSLSLSPSFRVIDLCFRSWLFPESYKGRSNQAGRIEGMEKGQGGGQED